MTDHERAVSIAEARYAIRKVFRIVEEQARAVDLEPLQHQLLLQIYGAPLQHRSVKDVADRLDIAPAFASRMIRKLEDRGLVERGTSDTDRRVVEVHISDAGRELVHQIDDQVGVHVAYFQQGLSLESKLTALDILAFYVGLQVPDAAVAMIRKASSPKR